MSRPLEEPNEIIPRDINQVGGQWPRYEVTLIFAIIIVLALLRAILHYMNAILKLFYPLKPPQREISIANVALNILRSPSEGPSSITRLLHSPKSSTNKFQDIEECNCLLSSYISTGYFHSAHQLFMKIRDKNSTVKPDIDTYEIYIHGILVALRAGRTIDVNMTDELLAEMRQRKIALRSNTENLLMEIFGVVGNTWKMRKYYTIFQKAGIKPNSMTYERIFKGTRNTQDLQCFETFFPLLLDFVEKEAKVVEDSLINVVIEASKKTGSLDKLEKFLSLLKSKQKRLTLEAYRKLINIYGVARKDQKVTEILCELKSFKVQLNETLYEDIMEAYLRCNMCDKVEEAYNEAQANKTLNINIHTTLIKALAKKCDLLRIISVYEELKSTKDFKLDCATYNVFLDACAKCENYKKMFELFEDMKGTELSNKKHIIPDITTYFILIKAMSKIGNMEKSLSLYKEMKDLKIEITEQVINSLLDGCIRHNYNKTTNIINEIQYTKPSYFTYNLLIKLYTKQQLIDKSLHIFKQMKLQNTSPELIPYTILIQGCIKKAYIDKAIELFKEGKTALDKETYSNLVNGCIKHGKVLEGCDLLVQAIEDNIILSIEAYDNVLKSLLENNKLTKIQNHEYATTICNYVKLHKVQVNEEYYEKVMERLVFVPVPVSEYNKVNYYKKYTQESFYYQQSYQPHYAVQYPSVYKGNSYK